MNIDRYLVITSIAGPKSAGLSAFARQSALSGVGFIVVGDALSPGELHIDNCDFWSLARQKELPFELAELLQKNSYARKNLGYLLAMRAGARLILETDDDNIPTPEFWHDRGPTLAAPVIENAGWVNVYRNFTPLNIWPRGFALEKLGEARNPYFSGERSEVHAPIHQGLTDKNPDVDAICRISHPLPITFNAGGPVALGQGSWCPINSQNTTWFKEAFALMYLPSRCSFRMTDIWRGLIAQRIAWTCGWRVAFHGATVSHERNEHDILKDLSEEVVGYLRNGRIAAELQRLDLKAGEAALYDNLLTCYAMMIAQGFIGSKEMELVKAWIRDCQTAV
jgi:hypothetical protein